MRDPTKSSCAYVTAVVSALALIGCGRNQAAPLTDITPLAHPAAVQTQSAAAPAPPVRVPQFAQTSPQVPDSQPTAGSESRSPLHEPSGPRVSDVGMPYPLPSIAVDMQPPPSPRAPASSSFAQPFLGTTFRQAPADRESSFGPDAGL
jgi:hypothetical protein